MLLMAAFTILTLSVFASEKTTLGFIEKKCTCTKCGCAKGKCDCTTKSCKCPDCSMDKKPVSTTAKYACPMHAEVTSDKPGKCSKCGMDLKATKKDKTHFD